MNRKTGHFYPETEVLRMKNLPDVILNFLVVLIMVALLVMLYRKIHRTMPEKWKEAFRYFTTLSNMLSAAACLLTGFFAALGDVPEWVWLLKFVGTAAVTVTMLTVFLVLAPSIGKGWEKELLTGQVSDFFMHLISPLLALVSFCVFERRDLAFPQALLGVIPVILYGALYLYKIRYAPEGKRWPDFYGFTRGGKVFLPFAGMVAGTFAICMILMLVQ